MRSPSSFPGVRLNSGGSLRPTLLLLIVLAACVRPTSTPVAAAPAEPAQAVPVGEAKAFMTEHRKLASEARDSVIEGDVERFREVGTWIAAYSSDDLPEAWQPRISELRFHGRAMSNTTDRGTAAVAVAEMARACGVCHSENGPGPVFTFEPPPLDETSVDGRMARHQWAAERMWEGLVTPSTMLFETGARALTGAPMWSTEPLPEEVAGLEAQVRTIGEAALAATVDSERVEAYGSLISLCADCHARAR